VEGPVSSSELVEILQRTIDEQGAAFRSSVPDEQAALAAALRSSREAAEADERRRSAQQLRQEQDAAYLESLRKDQVGLSRQMDHHVTMLSERRVDVLFR
jgi:FAS-associated factor 2